MIILIAGASHTGKTLFAQKLLEKYKYPYLSIDHLKMGLIRSGQTNLTVEDDEQLTKYLWSIVVEMIKTVIENKQNFNSTDLRQFSAFSILPSTTDINRIDEQQPLIPKKKKKPKLRR